MNVGAYIGARLNGVIKRRAIAALIALGIAGIILCALTLIERRSAFAMLEDRKVHTRYAVDLLHDSLVNRIRQDVTRLAALGHYTTLPPDATGERFGPMAEYHLQQVDHFVGIGFAPDFKLQEFHFSSGESGFSQNTVQSMVTERIARFTSAAREDQGLTDPIIEASANGTVTLIVPSDPAASGSKTGAVVAVIDRQKLLETVRDAVSAKHHGETAAVRFEVRDKAHNDIIIGSGGPLYENPVSRPVDIPGSQWEILATPVGGWETTLPGLSSFRATLGVVAISMLLPILAAGFLLAERNRNIQVLRTRETKLLELSQRFKLAMDSSNIGIWEIENDTSVCYLDERAASMHGFPMIEKRMLLREWLTTISPEDRSKAARFFFNCSSGQETMSEVYRLSDANGTVCYLRSAGSSYTKPDGTHQTTGILWDVTSDMMMAQRLRESKDTSDIKNAELELALQELSSREHELEVISGRLKLALESYNCGIWEASDDYASAVWDERMCELYGIIPSPEKRITLAEYLKCLHPDDREQAVAKALERDRYPGKATIQRVVLPDGHLRYIKAVGRPHEKPGSPKMIVGIAFDVTADVLLSDQLKSAKEEAEAKNVELEQAKTHIEHNALHDPLTDLANRRKLDQELDDLSAPHTGERRRFAILHLDLDRFKQINDTLGHAAGDAVLAHTAKILRSTVREDDIVARIGGDEFVILVKHLGDKDHIRSIATKIIDSFSQPFDFEGFTCRYGVSIGIAFGEVGTVDARRTLINADLALYRAKATGRNRYEFFTQNLQAELVSHKRMADEILAGLERGEFETWYQPQFCVQTQILSGVEALVRWRHPVRGILTPDKFLKIAEELNVMAKIDQIVLQTALQDRKIWSMRGVDVPRISVNVSVRRLHDDHLIDSLQTLSILPGEVVFELVESIFLDENEDIATSNIERIKSMGIEIEMDDFGTGHTSIISLLRLKPKRLKIDRQLVMPILTSPQERSLVRSIIDIAHSLGVETIAEGVETLEHAAMLKDMSCDLVQGYAFARPLPPEEFYAFATAEDWRKVS